MTTIAGVADAADAALSAAEAAYMEMYSAREAATAAMTAVRRARRATLEAAGSPPPRRGVLWKRALEKWVAAAEIAHYAHAAEKAAAAAARASEEAEARAAAWAEEECARAAGAIVEVAGTPRVMTPIEFAERAALDAAGVATGRRGGRGKMTTDAMSCLMDIELLPRGERLARWYETQRDGQPYKNRLWRKLRCSPSLHELTVSLSHRDIPSLLRRHAAPLRRARECIRKMRAAMRDVAELAHRTRAVRAVSSEESAHDDGEEAS